MVRLKLDQPAYTQYAHGDMALGITNRCNSVVHVELEVIYSSVKLAIANTAGVSPIAPYYGSLEQNRDKMTLPRSFVAVKPFH